ncbi:hypothetical protein [Bacillus litorisediminis]|uniref:hypothetical protein n=1 Tax=Bacillus litorisediminis TaxID=2922713 RepID=UPI001FAF4736|nr:hypothetical protein [Bacillus litorisediminis]
MTDFRSDIIFQAKEEGTRAIIDSLARNGIPDAIALVERGMGLHGLRGHEASIIPLAVLFSQYNPLLLSHLRTSTNLSFGMGGRNNPEANDDAIWRPIKNAMVDFKARHGADIISEEVDSGNPQSVERVMNTYLSTSYLGGQPNGGGGNTVFKRTLKLLGHVYY